jgi:hypothetical protein
MCEELMRPVIRQFPDLDPDAEFLSKKSRFSQAFAR